MLYLLLIQEPGWTFFKENGGYDVPSKIHATNSDVGDAGYLYSVISGNVEQFLELLSEPETPNEYNEVMKYIFDNPHLVLSVASYVFDISPSPEDDANTENENESTVARRLEFGGGGKNRKSRRKGKKQNKKKTLKRRTRKSK